MFIIRAGVQLARINQGTLVCYSCAMQLRSQILHSLSDGEFHSGESLGAALGVTRMAIWKHLKTLRESGLVFEIVRGKGYRLPQAVEMLDAERLLAAVRQDTRAVLGPVDIHLELDSTNNQLREQALAGAPSGTVCLAEMQHKGRGRHGKHWVSPFAANLYLSLLWRTSVGAASLGGLSLVAGISLLRSLRAFDIHHAGLKWPNDVLVDGAKLGGILIDVVGEANGPCAVVIGVGINVAMPAATVIDQSWTDLCTVTGNASISRNRLGAALLDSLLPALAEFETGGLLPFMDEWNKHDVTAGQSVELFLPDQTISGMACGIDDGGALLVETANGRKRFASGEVSLRLSP